MFLLFQNCGSQSASEFFNSSSESENNDETAVSEAQKGVVFETDFSQDSGFNAPGPVRNWHVDDDGNEVEPPKGFGGIRVGPGCGLSVVPEGINSSNALKVVYGGGGRSSLSLGAHLTGATNSGYKELYVRYNIKLPPKFKAGTNGRGLQFWKWGRLWQNTTPEISGWSENIFNSGYVVWGVYPAWRGSQNFAAAFADNKSPTGNHSLGSNGGPFQYLTWRQANINPYEADGHFQSVGNGAWQLDLTRPGFLVEPEQVYHTLEWRFKLASSPEAEDGAFEMWIDGEKQIDYTSISNAFEAPVRNGIPTVADPNGFNHFTLFDNLQNWSDHWANPEVDGYILVNDVVISTGRIGHDYLPVGTTTTSKP